MTKRPNAIEVNLDMELEKLLKNIEVPKKAITAAKRLLNSPPEEDIWVTHGMLIAGIGHVLNLPSLFTAKEVICKIYRYG